MLAAEDIIVTIGSERIMLRPTLARALRLERRHEGLQALIAKILDGNLEAIADVLAENAGQHSDAVAFIERLGQNGGIFDGVASLILPLVDYCHLCAGVDLDELETDNGRAKSPARLIRTRRDGFAAHLAELFRVATGWLGWTPATAWNSTPAEIREAREGFIEIQNLLRGAKPKEADDRPLDDKFADVFLTLATKASSAS